MERRSYADFACSIARTLDLVGEWWTPLIVRDLFLGIDRFDELQRDLGLASNVLAARLRTLVEAGVVERQPLPDDRRSARHVLTERGRDLYPVLLSLMAWGDKWLAGAAGAPLQVVHARCGAVTAAVPHCSVCGEPLALHEVQFRAGPGGRHGEGTAVLAERFAAAAAAAAGVAAAGDAGPRVTGDGSTASPAPSGRKRGR